MRRFVSVLTAALIAGMVSATAAFGFGLPFYSGPLQPGNILETFNNLIGRINSTYGMLAAQPGPVASTATTAEQTFATTTLPPATLSSAGQTLDILCSGTTAANGNNKTANLYFAGNKYSTATMSTSAESWQIELIVTAVTATANSVILGRGTANTTVVAPVASNDTSDNLTSAITVKCTGTQGNASAADMTMENFTIMQAK